MNQKLTIYLAIGVSLLVSCSKSAIDRHYLDRVNAFNQEPIVTGHVIFLGDSFIENGDWRWLTGDPTVLNRGINGDKTAGVLKRLDDIILRQPSKLFILIGINDIATNVSDADIAGNYRKIITRVKAESPGTIIYVQSILPVNNKLAGFQPAYDQQSRIISVNVLLQQLAINHVYVDIHSLFLNAEQKLDERYTIEGVHLNYDGYLKWVSFLKSQHYL